MISLKYYDQDTAESKKILILPSMSDQMFKFNFGRELEMTKFIRDRIMESNPNYSKELEPSRWLPAGLIFITGIPAFLFMNVYF
ncbi:MAG: hypothetical protein HC831_08210 [Chloroflexia bacterium]|nr:hypothetical protein [Chloroflexia bacterium]